MSVSHIAASRILPKDALLAACLLLPAACATTASEIPANAVESIRTQANGDVVTEYRVAGQLRVVKVTPERGPTYYLIDRNADGRFDASDGDVSPVYYKLYEW